METHVYANDNEICSKAADGKATVPTDPCWSPPPPSAGPVVVVYPNTAKAADLAQGSETVDICGTPVALRDKSYFSTSTGNEAATRQFPMGVASHTITGKMYFTDWSPNVKVEGLNVCRHCDPTTHNHA
ncbi:DUF4150 domain-containing protein [Pelomonas sp. BJYL3]|uniref:DUF4150 domain-containing protein n=1 Tax=Pelomonas sp. BJYL3 TaxID=2976697 RepID=UPI0022B38262|nr:DUF4150 domain-containing protein [Pelomonas sp. BJYL3]